MSFVVDGVLNICQATDLMDGLQDQLTSIAAT